MLRVWHKKIIWLHQTAVYCTRLQLLVESRVWGCLCSCACSLMAGTVRNTFRRKAEILFLLICAEALAPAWFAVKLLGKLLVNLDSNICWLGASWPFWLCRVSLDISQKLPGLRVPSSMASSKSHQRSGPLCVCVHLWPEVNTFPPVHGKCNCKTSAWRAV